MTRLSLIVALAALASSAVGSALPGGYPQHPKPKHCNKWKHCGYGEKCVDQKDHCWGHWWCPKICVPDHKPPKYHPKPPKDECKNDWDCGYGQQCVKDDKGCKKCKDKPKMPPGPAPCATAADCPGPGDTCTLPYGVTTCPLKDGYKRGGEVTKCGKCTPPTKPSGPAKCNVATDCPGYGDTCDTSGCTAYPRGLGGDDKCGKCVPPAKPGPAPCATAADCPGRGDTCTLPYGTLACPPETTYTKRGEVLTKCGKCTPPPKPCTCNEDCRKDQECKCDASVLVPIASRGECKKTCQDKTTY